ncbi:MAG: xanthine dehydrogenase family protein subunit M [Candidatus Thermoplasmatota archaeon]|nr:xanthine dehydrogenase family protein subunit M [Candidatus Thermoplasmatota archaeon]
MYPGAFDYQRPQTLKEAVNLLDSSRGNARVLAGGMSLIPLLKSRIVSIPVLVDIGRISELRKIENTGDTVRIGSMVTDHEIEHSKTIGDKFPLITEVSKWIGDPQVRNRGTMGGSLCHADPSGDWGACLIALRGKVHVSGPNGSRAIDSDSFFTGPFSTSLDSSEILTGIEFNEIEGMNGSAYEKIERKAGDFATVGIAVQISTDEKGVCIYAGIGLTSVSASPIRAVRAEKELLGKELKMKNIESAAMAASDECDPSDDPLRGSAEFKRYLVKVCTKRALIKAIKEAGGVL